MPDELKWNFGLLCGLALFGIQIFGFYRLMQSTCWSTTSRQVVSATTSGTGRARRAVIEYEYQVAREKYSCQTVGWGGLSFAHSTIDKYPGGTAVEVFYNPANPSDAANQSDAVLGREFPLTAYLVMLVAIGICLAFGWPLFCAGKQDGADLQPKNATVPT